MLLRQNSVTSKFVWPINVVLVSFATNNYVFASDINTLKTKTALLQEDVTSIRTDMTTEKVENSRSRSNVGLILRAVLELQSDSRMRKMQAMESEDQMRKMLVPCKEKK